MKLAVKFCGCETIVQCDFDNAVNKPGTVQSNKLLCTNIDQKLVNSLHRLLNCEIGGLDCRVITIEYRTRVHCIHM